MSHSLHKSIVLFPFNARFHCHSRPSQTGRSASGPASRSPDLAGRPSLYHSSGTNRCSSVPGRLFTIHTQPIIKSVFENKETWKREGWDAALKASGRGRGGEERPPASAMHALYAYLADRVQQNNDIE